MTNSPDAAPSAGLTPHDWIQLEQAAIGCTSGIENWPALRTAIQKVVANKNHSDALRRLVEAAKGFLSALVEEDDIGRPMEWERHMTALSSALAALEAGGGE